MAQIENFTAARAARQHKAAEATRFADMRGAINRCMKTDADRARQALEAILSKLDQQKDRDFSFVQLRTLRDSLETLEDTLDRMK